jgi:hypothetical protein
MALTPVLVFSVLIAGLGLSLTNDPRKMPSMLPGKTLPPFALASLGDDGKSFSSADLKGKVSLLNVFVIDRSGVGYRLAGALTEDVWQEIFEPILAQLQVWP